MRRRLRRKVGHAGTLDPFAEGVLILLVGEATRRFAEVQKWPKTYRAILRLGRETDTLDPEGKTVRQMPVPELSEEEIRRALKRWEGEILQAPPLFSARRVAGRRLYEYARSGAAVEVPAKRVKVHRLRLARWTPPDLEFTAEVASGVYLRSLARDIASELGTCGHLVRLVREKIGPIARKDCQVWK